MSKTVSIAGDYVTIEGVSETDPYYASIGEGFEADFVAMCRRLIRPGDTVLDVGANIGVTTVVLSRMVPHGRVIALEPSPHAYAALRHNLAVNGCGNVEAHQVAASDVPGVVGFHDASAWGHIMDSVGAATHVDAVTIDSLLSGRKIDFVKIDVEGYEHAALRGAKQTLAGDPIVYLEFNAWCQTCWSRTNPLTFMEWLFETFRNIYTVGADGVPSKVTVAPFQLTHDIMVHRNCIDNLLVTNRDFGGG